MCGDLEEDGIGPGDFHKVGTIGRITQMMRRGDVLVLAFEAGGGPSPGTAKTSVEGLGKGGRARAPAAIFSCVASTCWTMVMASRSLADVVP